MIEIEKELDELLDLIKNTKIYQEYLEITKNLEKNKIINELISDIKKSQQEAVKKEETGNLKEVKKLDDITNEKLEKLYQISLYQEYIQVAKKLNDLINEVKLKFQNYFDNI